MQNVISTVFILAAITASTASATNAAGKSSENADWMQKAKSVRTELTQLTARMKERIKQPPGTAEEKMREVDKASEKLNRVTTECEQLMAGFEAARERRTKELAATRDAKKEELARARDQRRTERSKATQERRNELDTAFEERRKELDSATEEYKQGMAEYKQARTELENARKGLYEAMEGFYEAMKVVVVLKDVELRVEAKTVGTARKGEKLIAEDSQGNWLWVRAGETAGWIDKGGVVSAALLAWYQRLPDFESVEAAGQTRARVHGVTLEIVAAGAGPMSVRDSFKNIGYPVPDGLLYDNVNVQLGSAVDGRRPLLIKFNSAGARAFPPPPPGRSYGTVQQSDHVFISTKDRQVFVNGELRTPR